MARAARREIKLIPLGVLGLVGALYATYALTSTRVANQIEIHGDAARIFDLVTTAKYWSEWHPATLAVSDDIEHPMRVGDSLHERVNIFGPTANVDWTVTRVDRPRSLTLHGHSLFGGCATIDYQFISEGDGVKFTRALDYTFFGLGGPLDWFLDSSAYGKPIGGGLGKFEKVDRTGVGTMTKVMNRSEISGAPEFVFDLVTTGKYWTQWHPATLGVSGDIDAPMKLGDTIREHARIGAGEGEADWKVVEHERPRGVVLRTQTPTFTHLQITYTFTPRGNAVEFTRALEYELNPALGFAASPVMDFQHRDDARLRPLMEQQSAEAVTRLKVFVEQMKQK